MAKMQEYIKHSLNRFESLKKKMKDYHSKYNSLKKMVKRLERDVEDLNDVYVDRKTVVKLIQEIVLSIINKKRSKGAVYKDSSYLSESFKDSNSVEIIEIRERKAVSHKQ